MFQRIVWTGLSCLWIYGNMTLFPALVILGWANLGTEQDTFGRWLIAAGGIPLGLYVLLFALGGRFDDAADLARSGFMGGSLAGSLLFVFGVYGFLLWLLMFPVLGILGGGPIRSCLNQNAAGDVSLACNLLWWPGWFF